jgi:hypothetical protein
MASICQLRQPKLSRRGAQQDGINRRNKLPTGGLWASARIKTENDVIVHYFPSSQAAFKLQVILCNLKLTTKRPNNISQHNGG